MSHFQGEYVTEYKVSEICRRHGDAGNVYKVLVEKREVNYRVCYKCKPVVDSNLAKLIVYS
jgi:hypothetical protein